MCSRRGTGNILQDLISSTVLLKNIKVSKSNPDEFLFLEQDNSDPAPLNELCNICGSGSEPCQLLTLNQVGILQELTSSSLHISTVKFLCPGCCLVLENLAKLKKKIELITQTLKTLLRIQHKRQNNINVPSINHECEEKLQDNDNNASSPTSNQVQNQIEFELIDIEDTDKESEKDKFQNESEELKINPSIELELTDTEDINDDVDDCQTLNESEGLNPNNHGDNQSDIGSRLLANVPSTKISCRICCLNYASDYSLNRHYASNLHQEGVKSRKVTAEPAMFGCYLCPEEFHVLGELISHQKSQHKSSNRLSKSVSDKESKFISSSEQYQNPVNCDDEMKAIVCELEVDIPDEDMKTEPFTDQLVANHDTEFISMERDLTEQHIEPEVRITRKSAARATKFLHTMLKSGFEVGNESDIDISIDEDDSSDESGNDSEIDAVEIRAKKSKKSRRVPHPPSDPLECVICRHKSLNLDALEIHKAQHPKCDVCLLTFKTNVGYRLHLLSPIHELGQKTRRITTDGYGDHFKCPECDETFKSLAKSRNHIHKAHPGNLKRKHFVEPYLPSDPLECVVCRHKALDPEELALHQSHHPDMECDVCVISFKSDKTYTRHLSTPLHELGRKTRRMPLDGGKPVFACNECDHSFTGGVIKMYFHMIVHKGPFICEQCGKQLSNSQSLKFHITHVHSGKPKKIPKPPNRLVPQERRVKCKLCERRFADKSGMYRHLKSVHKKIRAKCNLCPKDYSSHTGLYIHKKKTHGKGSYKVDRQPKVSCDICDRTLVGPMNMNRHIELIHFPNKTSCPYGCSGEFGNEKEWISHLEGCKSEKLTESSKCYCFFCGDIFPTQLLRIAHHLRVHKSFPCKLCSRFFTRDLFLTFHVEAGHKNIKPFLCPKCGKGFRQQLNLQFHSTTVCGEDEEAKKELLAKRRELHRKYREKAKAHKCHQCSKSFVDERRLEDHKRKVHLNQDSNSEEEDNEPVSD